MFWVGDKVIYGVHGVCVVTDQQERIVDHKKVVYLVLEPVVQDGSQYLVPTHNASAMGKLKQILSREQMETLLFSEEIRKDWWIPEENLRKQTYRELIVGGDREKLLRMMYTLYNHKKAQNAAGRKFHLCDENFLRDAEKLLLREMTVVMDVDMDTAKAYLKKRLNPA